ncbi:predicted protein [Plenodomus lingam JN3]|uniref:Predicted protein n=1 Tax=Leptosphaeria maculans (strain JN3 / isolate v23.1.3 / race Av1-4-5-6-7-8) TaxID=985895 RepID=E4ZZI9_LEPMJ|nr:predicted protein [Plenodomus lingam JN3]CBX97105.1 predicted protein [Plenodomus lingam JN3]
MKLTQQAPVPRSYSCQHASIAAYRDWTPGCCLTSACAAAPVLLNSDVCMYDSDTAGRVEMSGSGSEQGM